MLACHLQIDVDPDPVPDPVYYFDAEPDPDFYLMRIRIRMRIQVTKMMRDMGIWIHNTEIFRIKSVNMGILQAPAPLESVELAKRDTLGPGPGGSG